MIRFFAGILLPVLLLAGCISSPPPKEVFYRFSDSGDVAAASNQLPGSLRVERLKAEGILSERPLLFSHTKTPGKLEQYRYHLWSEPPSSLLTQRLTQTLQSAGVATKVVDADLRTPVDYSIDGNLQRLERVIKQGQDSAVVEIRLRLLHFKTRELVLQNVYKESVDIDGDSVTMVATALSQAANRIFQRFISDLPEMRKARSE